MGGYTVVKYPQSLVRDRRPFRSDLTEAELLELKAMREAPAQGVVIESRLDKGRTGCDVLIQNGNFEQGNVILAGEYFGRVRLCLITLVSLSVSGSLTANYSDLTARQRRETSLL